MDEDQVTPTNVTVQNLVNMHKTVIFPTIFKQITFDMIAELEFELEKKGQHFFLTSSDFWMTPDRNEKGHFQLVFSDKADAKKFGKLVDPGMRNMITKKNATFRIGYTQDVTHINKPDYKNLICERVSYEP